MKFNLSTSPNQDDSLADKPLDTVEMDNDLDYNKVEHNQQNIDYHSLDVDDVLAMKPIVFRTVRCIKNYHEL